MADEELEETESESEDCILEEEEIEIRERERIYIWGELEILGVFLWKIKRPRGVR